MFILDRTEGEPLVDLEAHAREANTVLIVVDTLAADSNADVRRTALRSVALVGDRKLTYQAKLLDDRLLLAQDARFLALESTILKQTSETGEA